MNKFDFATNSLVTFGNGALTELPAQVLQYAGPAAKVLLVIGRTGARAEKAVAVLEAGGISVSPFSTDGEPTIDLVRRGVEAAKEETATVVVGFGGGSAMDAAKAIAALTTNSGEPLDYLEVVGRGGRLEHPSLPCLTVPTTAGTGAEVTRNAVLGVPDQHLKASLRGTYVQPRAALIDPELTWSLPPATTAETGFDTLTQLLEAFVSRRANPMTDLFCREGLARVRRSFRTAFRSAESGDENEPLARADMSFASLLSGLALANAGLGAVHGFASPLGGMLPAAHGAICASLLVGVVKANLRALRQRQPENPAGGAMLQAAEILTGTRDADALVDWIAQLRSDLGIKPLGQLGFSPAHSEAAVERAQKASSMRGNPLDLTPEELREILDNSINF